jgi:Na+/melibiose symporter-like transporter
MAEKIDTGSVGYVLGVLSIVFAFFNPGAGLILGIIGFVQSKKAKLKKAQKLNIIGMVLSAILLIVSLVIIAYGAATGWGTNFPIM